MKTDCVCLVGEALVTVGFRDRDHFDTSTNILLKATVTEIDLMAFNYLNDCRL